MTDSINDLRERLLDAVVPPPNTTLSAASYLLKWVSALLIGAAFIWLSEKSLGVILTELPRLDFGDLVLLVVAYGAQVATLVGLLATSHTVHQDTVGFPTWLRAYASGLLQAKDGFSRMLRQAGHSAAAIPEEQIAELVSSLREELPTARKAFAEGLNDLNARWGLLVVGFSIIGMLTLLRVTPLWSFGLLTVVVAVHLGALSLHARMTDAYLGRIPTSPFEMLSRPLLFAILASGYVQTWYASVEPRAYANTPDVAAHAIIEHYADGCRLAADKVALPRDYPMTATVCSPEMLAYLNQSADKIAEGITQLSQSDFVLAMPSRESMPRYGVRDWPQGVIVVRQATSFSTVHVKPRKVLTISVPSDQLHPTSVILN